MDDVPQVNPKSDAIKREMYRKSLDLIRVYNPTDKDYVLDWDGFKHIIPSKNKDTGYGKGQTVFFRYLARKYRQEMKDLLINEMGERKVEESIAGMKRSDAQEYIDDPLKRQRLWDKAPRTDDQNEIRRIYAIVWLGVEKEYGLEEIEEPTGARTDSRSFEDQMEDELNKPYNAPVVSEDTYPINKKKNDVPEEVAA